MSKNPELLIFLLIVDVVTIVYTMYQLREGQTKGRGMYGFWLAWSLNGACRVVLDLLALLK